MSERKVLNKYYPPDFDPSKIPRLHLPKERQYTVRLMAPCNMKCKTCGEYIYKGKKFNARKETVQGEDYLGLKIFRFYIKCTRCLAEITFKTDPQNADYIVEHGATRNFQALKLAEEQAEREQRDKDEEEASNPMKLLENRTKASKQEMDVMESLEELRELQERHANVDYQKILSQHVDQAALILRQQEEEDEAFVQSIFGSKDQDTGTIIKRIVDEGSDSDEDSTRIRLRNELEQVNASIQKPTDLLLQSSQQLNKKLKTWDKSEGGLPAKSLLHGIVKRKSTPNSSANSMPKAEEPSLEKQAIVNQSFPTGLGLIEGYSDSSNDDADSE